MCMDDLPTEQNSIPTKKKKEKTMELDDFTMAYIEAALWTSGCDEESFDEVYSWEDLDPDTLAKVKEDCQQFQTENKDLLEEAYKLYPDTEWTPQARAGHDFWLTRNGHGAGFWDRGIGEVGDDLTKACEKWGEVWWEAEDNKVYQL